MAALLSHRQYHFEPHRHSLRILTLRAGTPAQSAVFDQLLSPRFRRTVFDCRAGAAVSLLFPLRIQIGLAFLFWQFERRMEEMFSVRGAISPRDQLLLNGEVTGNIPGLSFLLDCPNEFDIRRVSDLLENPFLTLGPILTDTVDRMFEHWGIPADPTLRTILSSNDLVLAGDTLCTAWNFNAPTMAAINAVIRRWNSTNWLANTN